MQTLVLHVTAAGQLIRCMAWHSSVRQLGRETVVLDDSKEVYIIWRIWPINVLYDESKCHTSQICMVKMDIDASTTTKKIARLPET